MPKPVKLTPDADQPDKPTEAAFEVPPAATMPEGVSGKLPLPPGEVVGATAQIGGNDALKTLERIGWQRGQPIPESMRSQINAAVLASLEEIAEGEVPPQADPNAKPLQVETKDISELPPDKQQEINAALADALQTGPRPAAPPDLAPPAPSAALDELEKARQITAPTVKTADDFPTPNTPDDTGAGNAVMNCPHCNWDLSVEDPVEPSPQEKHHFLQSVLGLKPYVKEYELFNGRIMLRIRTLTTREIDACYQQLYAEQQRGEIMTDMDFVERVSRLRMFLQVQRLYSKDGTKFDHDLPDGLSKDTNPNAEAHWDFPPDTKEPLKLIEEHLTDNVITNESLSRIVMQHCNRFNRLVAKLEAVADDPNFWKAMP